MKRASVRTVLSDATWAPRFPLTEGSEVLPFAPDGRVEVSVDGWLLSEHFAAHRNHRGQWVVLHMNSGLVLCRLTKLKLCRLAAEKAEALFGALWASPRVRMGGYGVRAMCDRIEEHDNWEEFRRFLWASEIAQ